MQKATKAHNIYMSMVVEFSTGKRLQHDVMHHAYTQRGEHQHACVYIYAYVCVYTCCVGLCVCVCVCAYRPVAAHHVQSKLLMLGSLRDEGFHRVPATPKAFSNELKLSR